MPTFDDVVAARQRLAQHLQPTPAIAAGTLSRVLGTAVHYKLETLQPTGSFKLRGAFNRVLSLADDERAAGVVTASTGNHGRALAYAGRQLGIRVVVCLSSLVPESKLQPLRELGVEIVTQGAGQDEAMEVARGMADTDGLTFVSPFDDAHVIAGQGTIALEAAEQLGEIDQVLVPVSGGGLISGIALAAKTLWPTCRVIGISMENGAAMHASLAAGRPVEVDEVESLADSLGGGISLDNRFTFELVRRHVDALILVPEEEIAIAMAFALARERIVVEGAAAVGIAALLHGRVTDHGERSLVVLSGCNVDTDQLMSIWSRSKEQLADVSGDAA